MKTSPLFRSIVLVLFGLVPPHHARAQTPKLSIASAGGQSFILSWPATASDSVLESAPNLDLTAGWRTVAARPTLANQEFQLIINSKDSAQFFRLIPAPALLPSGDFLIGDYTLISRRSLTPSLSEDTFTANVSNWGTVDATVNARLSSTAADVTAVEGSLSFGEVPAGATRESSGSWTVRYDPNKPFDETAFAWTVLATPLPPTSFALIEKALAAGNINAETALVYKVYVEFSDDRLPAPYRGRSEGSREARALMEVAGQFKTLSPASQQILAPFLLRPDAPGSWYELRTARPSLQRLQQATARPVSRWMVETRPNVNVHWDQGLRPNNGDAAKRFAAELERVWPKLTGLLGFPLSRANPNTNGPIEVLIVDRSTITATFDGDTSVLAYATGYSPSGCTDQAPAFMVVSANVDMATLVHEFAHVILFRYKLKTGCWHPEYAWLHEATATWVEHFIYPDGKKTYPGGNLGDSEHEYGSSFLGYPQLELESTFGTHAYGAYLWFLFITRGVDRGADRVRTTWDACANFDSLAAINAAIIDRGGLDKEWPEFALYNWNRKKQIRIGTPGEGQPYRYYATWDRLTDQAKEVTPTPVRVRLNGQASATYSLPHVIPHLAARYFHYDFRTDDTIRGLTFTHPYWSGSEPTAKVQAIVKIRDEDWKPAEDWTGIQKKYLCRDRAAEDVEELVIVISNSKFTDRSHVLNDDTTELKVLALGCNPWIGSIQFSYTNRLSVLGATEEVTETATATDVVFSLMDPDTGDHGATSGLVTWTHQGSFTGGGLQCSGEATGTFLVAAGDSLMKVTTFSPPFGDDSTLFYSAFGEVGFLKANIDFILYNCSPAGVYPPQQQQLFRRWLMTNALIPPGSFDQIIPQPDGSLLMKGDAKQGAFKWHWEFKQVRTIR